MNGSLVGLEKPVLEDRLPNGHCVDALKRRKRRRLEGTMDKRSFHLTKRPIIISEVIWKVSAAKNILCLAPAIQKMAGFDLMGSLFHAD